MSCSEAAWTDVSSLAVLQYKTLFSHISQLQGQLEIFIRWVDANNLVARGRADPFIVDEQAGRLSPFATVRRSQLHR